MIRVKSPFLTKFRHQGKDFKQKMQLEKTKREQKVTYEESAILYSQKQNMKSFLFILTSFVVVTSLLSGFLMISNPDGEVLNLSVRLLKGTPFRDFKIPGILLTTLVGITNSVAKLFIIIRQQKRYIWTLAGGILLCG